MHHRFSCKSNPDAPDYRPPAGYGDYHTKVTRYIEIIVAPTSRTARAFKPIKSVDDEAIFLYTDSAFSRAAITNVSHAVEEVHA